MGEEPKRATNETASMSVDYEEMAEEAKQRGNGLFVKKSYEEALVCYQEAIGHAPSNHVLYSNTAACHMELAAAGFDPLVKLECHARALQDARKCTELKPDWPKGWLRQSAAEFNVVTSARKCAERNKENAKWDAEGSAGIKMAEPRKLLAPSAELAAVVESANFSGCESSCRAGLAMDAANAALRSRLQQLRDEAHVTDVEADRTLRDSESAQIVKAEGNKHFTAKQYAPAVEKYTMCLSLDPFDHVFYSNRSACHAALQDFEQALRDSKRCVELAPAFVKGYSRLSVALYHLGQYGEAEAAAAEGLALDADNAPLQECLRQAQVETSESLEVQKQMHKLRSDKRQDAKLQNLLKGLGGAGGVQMFNGSDLSGMFGGAGGGLGGMMGNSSMGGFGGGGKANMSEEQMRNMARAMASAETKSPDTK